MYIKSILRLRNGEHVNVVCETGTGKTTNFSLKLCMEGLKSVLSIKFRMLIPTLPATKGVFD